MARPRPYARAEQVSGGPVSGNSSALSASAAIYRPHRRVNPTTDRASIAKPWQIEAYRHVNICGEARYAATLFAALAGRAEIGISEPQALARKPVWINSGPEVDFLAELAPSVRERSKLIRDFMLHRIIAGECYLIARERVDTDPGYIAPVEADDLESPDLMDPDFDRSTVRPVKAPPIWEIVAVTEIQKVGETWKVRHDNGNYIELSEDDPVIRMWSSDPENRREAWSPFRSLLPTLREIEWLTRHIFTQVRSRLMSAGVWFIPKNLTFPPPPPDAVEGGAEAIAQMNDAEQFMLSITAASMALLEGDEVSIPTIAMADAEAMAQIDQQKLIQFWSNIDDKAMTLRRDAVGRFALGMDLPPEQVLGSSGIAMPGGGNAGSSVNHWGVWANEEQTISAHIEPALDDLVSVLTTAILRTAVEGTDKVVAYDTASLRLRQDRSKEALQWYDRGVLKAKVALRETGFDPDNDMMDPTEYRNWVLGKLVGGSATPDQVQAALLLLGINLPVATAPEDQGTAPRLPGRSQPPSLRDLPYEGPPREQHDHSPAPFSVQAASCEALVLRALEKAGNRLLNDGKRGRDKDRTTPAHMAHVTASLEEKATTKSFDFSLAPTMLPELAARDLSALVLQLKRYCARLYNHAEPYTREGLIEAMGAVS